MPRFNINRLAAKVETTKGTVESGVAATDLIRCIAPTLEVRQTAFERDVTRGSFSTHPRHFAQATGTLRFGVELAGHSSNTASYATPPLWTRLLQACGFLQQSSVRIGINGGVTGGPFQSGETITGGSSANTAVVGAMTYDGDVEIKTRGGVSGAFTSGETITGALSGATATVQAPLGTASAGWTWSRWTTPVANYSLTFHLENEQERSVLYGAEGNVTFEFRAHDRVIMQFEFQGIFQNKTTITSGSEYSVFLAGAQPTLLPPPWRNALSLFTIVQTGVISGTHLPIFSEATVNAGNNVAMRPNANALVGWEGAVIAGRAATASFNPDDPGASTYDFVDLMSAGSMQAVRIAVGSATYNNFTFHLDHLEPESATVGNRDERTMFNVAYRCTSGLRTGVDKDEPANNSDIVIFHG